MDRLRLVMRLQLTTTVFLDGGRAGIKLHDQVRIAAYCHLYAFDHGMQLDRPLYQQPVRPVVSKLKRCLVRVHMWGLKTD